MSVLTPRHAGTHAPAHVARHLGTLIAVLAGILVLALTSFPAAVAAASVAPGGHRADASADGRRTRTVREAAPKRAVIVVGPVGSSTTKYREKGNAIAAAAAAHGMEVTKIFTPTAVWSQVVAAANGADLFVYLGHGNGWPSPNPPFQEDSKNGLGLNPSAGTDNTTTKYYGADHLREQIRLAPNAIVILNKLCYAEGNGEPWMPIPTTDVARQRVDNFASGFLAIGAKAVFALGWQPGEDIVNALYEPTPKTMDDIFMTRFGSNRDGSYKPFYGWIGWKPDLYFASERTADARNHLDPDPQEGFLRAVTGDLSFTNTQWLGTLDTGDTEPPVLSDLSGAQAANTIPAGENAAPVFTPNGDKVSDTMTLRHTLSEGAFLKVEVKREDGKVVRTFNGWSPAGKGTSVWDGRGNGGKVVRDGRYDIVITPRDPAGNVGESVRTSVKVLTSIKRPAALPILFDPTDGDALAATTTLAVTLTREATIEWRIVNRSGDVVRHGPTDSVLPAGPSSWDWDGLDDAGQPLPQGTYTAMVTASTDAGRYSHTTVVRLMPFNLKGRLVVSGGQRQTLTITTAEPVEGWPVITIEQKGRAAYRLYPVRRSTTRFSAVWTAKRGDRGPITITISSTDQAGGTQEMVLKGRLK